MKEKFTVTGMTCSACSAGIERTVQKLQGVERVEVSLMGESMVVEYDETQLSRDTIIGKVVDLGYGATAFEENALQRKEIKRDKMKLRFALSLILLLPLMYLSMGEMLGVPTAWLPILTVNYILQTLLSTAILVLNFKFFINGTKALFKGVPNMDTLVAMGAAVSYSYSLVLSVLHYAGIHSTHHGAHLFFESAAMILTLVTLGKWLEEKSKRKTGDEVEKLIALMPNTVIVERSGEEQTIAFSEIAVGDILVVKQGDYIPVDGVVVFGHAFVDRAAITGESMPVEVTENDLVTGADVVKSGYLKVKAQKVGADTTLSQIVKMVKDAGASKAPIQKLADKIAGVFVPAVCLIAVAVFVVWMFATRDVALSANYAISVLVISCPCSLGLATPVAVMAATGKGMALGILYKDAETLQKAKDVTHVLLDKTATLTVGTPQVTDFECLSGDKAVALQVALSMESRSNHPIAECIKAFGESNGAQPVEVENYRYVTGKGAYAVVQGVEYSLGNRKLLPSDVFSSVQERENAYAAAGKTAVFLSDGKKVLAIFAVADTLKDTSKDAVSALKKSGVRVAMLTGDNERVAKAIADKVGIDEYFAETLPEDKANAVKQLRSSGGVVAMVGDGINDSPALKSADVGVAMGTGTDVAIESADVVLVAGDLRSLSTMMALSKATVKNIKQNLFWAFFYNCVAIPIAGGAFAFARLTLNPMIAAACMSLSSLFVVTNALRLTRFGNKKEKKKENGMKTKVLAVEGMMCKHCVAHVTKALQAVAGVESVEVSLEKGTATVFGSATDDALVAAVTSADYEVKAVLTK